MLTSSNKDIYIRNLFIFFFFDTNIKQKTISSKDMFKFLLIKYVKKNIMYNKKA